MLGGAEEITRAAGFKVVLCHGEAVRRAAQKLQPLPHGIVAVVGNQNAAGIRRAAPNAAAQLVQCRQAEPLGVLNDHDRGVGHVDADLDDRRRDKHIQLARLELLHHIVLFLRLHLAVQKPDAAVGQQCAGRLGVVGRHGLQVAHGLVFLDGRADDVHLMPRRDLFVQKAVHIPALFAGDKPCFDGLAAWRQLVQDGNIQVAVHQKPQRARDGRGAHDQQVRALGLARQQAALPHAETVLLVHNGKTEIFEFHGVRQHGMRTYDQICPAVGDSFQRDAFFFGLHAADQQRDIDAEGLQPVRQRDGVLPGQNFRGGQHGALPAVLCSEPDSCRRHQRFAAADVALQQAIHWNLAAQVPHNFLGRALLCAGGRVRQAAPERP